MEGCYTGLHLMVDMGECYCKFKPMRKNILGLASVLMATSLQNTGNRTLSDTEVKAIIKKKVPVIQPKGTKEYFFNMIGQYSTDKSKVDGLVMFTCFAINDKNAVRKYRNFLIGR